MPSDGRFGRVRAVALVMCVLDFRWPFSAGINDATAKLNVMARFAHAWGCALAVPPPHTMLDPVHNGGHRVGHHVGWSHYYALSAHCWPREAVPWLNDTDHQQPECCATNRLPTQSQMSKLASWHGATRAVYRLNFKTNAFWTEGAWKNGGHVPQPLFHWLAAAMPPGADGARFGAARNFSDFWWRTSDGGRQAANCVLGASPSVHHLATVILQRLLIGGSAAAAAAAPAAAADTADAADAADAANGAAAAADVGVALDGFVAVRVRRGDRLDQYASARCSAPAAVAQLCIAAAAVLQRDAQTAAQGTTPPAAAAAAQPPRRALIFSDERDPAYYAELRARLVAAGFVGPFFEHEIAELDPSGGSSNHQLGGGGAGGGSSSGRALEAHAPHDAHGAHGTQAPLHAPHETHSAHKTHASHDAHGTGDNDNFHRFVLGGELLARSRLGVLTVHPGFVCSPAAEQLVAHPGVLAGYVRAALGNIWPVWSAARGEYRLVPRDAL